CRRSSSCRSSSCCSSPSAAGTSSSAAWSGVIDEPGRGGAGRDRPARGRAGRPARGGGVGRDDRRGSDRAPPRRDRAGVRRDPAGGGRRARARALRHGHRRARGRRDRARVVGLGRHRSRAAVIVPAAWILATVRLWALLRVQAGWRAAVGPVWEVVALVLAFVLAAPLSQAGAVATLSWGTLAAEAALGTCLGLGLSLGGRAVVGAARWQADAFGVPPRAWTRLGAALAGVAAVGGGLHHAALAGLGHVVELWPLGRPDLWGMGDLSVLALLDGARALLVLGLALATPVVLVAATAQLALGAL